MKKIAFLFSSLLFSLGAMGQCDQCPDMDGFSADYCFVSEYFPDYCVQFQVEAKTFVLSEGKKSRVLPLVDDDSLQYYLTLSREKSYKLRAEEILLIQEAYGVWQYAKRDIGLQYTESGLGYKIIREGEGDQPQVGQNVSVHYTGMLADGTIFDSSYERGQPISFPLGQGRVIRGWDEGIALLKVGSRALLKIPADLGYGSRGAGGVIPPDATLYFEVELMEVE